MPSLIEQAIMLASDGFFIFPLVGDKKVPELANWQQISTTDIETIKGWFTDVLDGGDAYRNIGIDTGKSGLLVLDVDTKNGKHGDKTFDMYDMDYGFPDTLTAETATGGRHHYFYTSDLYGNTTCKLGDGLDTKAVGGYVVAPGSSIGDKSYIWLNRSEIAQLPEWLGEKLANHRIKADAVKDKRAVLSEDDPADIGRVVEWLENQAPASVKGAGGDATAYAVAAKCKEFGCSRETALDLMLEHWNPNNSPNWDAERLAVKVDNAYRYGQNATGSLSANAEFEGITVDKPDPKSKATQAVEINDNLFPDFARFNLADIPPRDWIYGEYLLRKKVSYLVAPPGQGKSTLTLLFALSISSGKSIIGIPAHGRHGVAIYNGEDELEEQQRRIGAAMQTYGLNHDDLYDEDVNGAEQRCMLSVLTGDVYSLQVAKRQGAIQAIVPADVDSIIASLKKKKVSVLVIDPFAETHPANENDNGEMLKVGKMYRRIAQEANCAVLLVHHTKKIDAASSDGYSGNLDAARGASALGGIVRIAFTFFTMSEKQAREYGVDPDRRKRYVGLAMAKANMSAVTDDIVWFERFGELINQNIDNPDGEAIGMLRPAVLARADTRVSEPLRALLLDLEELLIGTKGLSITAASEQLVAAFHNQLGKQPGTLSKAFRRMFADNTVHCGNRGKMQLIENAESGKGAGRKASHILVHHLDADELDSIS